MEVDNLREIYLRSQESLTRLGEDIKKLIDDSNQELERSKEFLETLIKENEEVDSQIKEHEAKISSQKNEMNNKSILKDELKLKHTELTKEVTEKKLKIETLKKENGALQEQLKKVEAENGRLNTMITNMRDELSTLSKENKELEERVTNEAETRQKEIDAVNEETKEIKAKNAVAAFLIEESAEEILEVDILVAVMESSNNKISKNDLKKALEGKIAPVMITRTLGRMTDKGLIRYDDSNDSISI